MIQTTLIYYIQTNATCVVILLYMIYTNSHKFRNNATEDSIFNRLIWSTVGFCIADLLSWYGDGSTFSSARAMVYIGNIIFICFYPVMSYIWVDYTLCKVKGTRLYRYTYGKILGAIMGVLLLLDVSTPFTKFAFTVDAANCYHRSLGAILSPAVAWVAILSVTVMIYLDAKKKRTQSDKDAIEMVFMFLGPTMAATILQLIFYGVSLFQVGFTLSLLMVFVNRQRNLISLDELTGLNNRHELNRYYDRIVHKEGVQRVCVYVIDINKFKGINDKFGHMEGDNALKALAKVLKRSINYNPNSPWFLARFGGDEFVLVGTNKGLDEIAEIKAVINAEIANVNAEPGRQYDLSVSFGYTEGRFGDTDTVSSLMERADANMYEEKKQSKK